LLSAESQAQRLLEKEQWIKDTWCVTGYLFQPIAKQVEDHRIVIWYDPEGVYTAAAAAFELPNTTVARYDGSFFQIQHDIDSLLNEAQPPRLVVYVPEDREKTDHALIELEVAGIVMQPGQQPPTHNTRLAIVARNALKSILGDETAADRRCPKKSSLCSRPMVSRAASAGAKSR